MSRYIIRFLSFIFNWMYNRGAWAYDLIAWLVSAGLWYRWVLETKFLVGNGRRLEIGFGTGHLLAELISLEGQTVGLERSSRMIKLTRRRLSQNHIQTAAIVHGTGYALPFVSNSFEAVVATFPAPYIFEGSVQKEIHRILNDEGQLIILLSASFIGTNIVDSLYQRFLASFKLAPGNPRDLHELSRKLVLPELFESRIEQRSTKRYILYFLIGHPK